eukprot:scaffold34440_cov45-Cyclotella_meneghiniana.AAC.3
MEWGQSWRCTYPLFKRRLSIMFGPIQAIHNIPTLPMPAMLRTESIMYNHHHTPTFESCGGDDYDSSNLGFTPRLCVYGLI